MNFNKISLLEQEVRLSLIKSLVNSKSKNRLVKNSSVLEDASDFFEENYQKLANTLEELLTSDQMQRLVSEKILPSLEDSIEQFIEKNKDKKDDYLKNPSLLMEDIENEYPLISMLKYLDDVLLAAFVASTVFTVWMSLFGPLGLTAAALTEAGKYFARKALKDFIKTKGKEFLKEIVAKITLKKLKTLATAGLTTIPKNLVVEAGRQASFLIALNTFLGVMQDLGFEVVKLLLIKEGSKKFGLPSELIQEVAGAESEGALVRILNNAKERVAEDLTKLFSTMEGFKRLALGAALNKFYSLVFPGKKATILATNAKLHIYDLIQQKDFKAELEKAKSLVPKELKQNIKELSPEAIKTKQNLEEVVEELMEKAKLPTMLFSPFKKLIAENEENLKDENKGKKEAKKLTDDSKFLQDEIKDNFREIALIEFIKKNFKRLEKDSSKLQPLLDDALDMKKANLPILIEQAEMTDANDFFNEAIRQKKVLLEVLLKRLSKGEREIEKLGEAIEEELDLEQYKASLEREVFGYE